MLCGREARNDIVLEPGRVAFTNFSEGIRVVDPKTGELRDSTKADIADIARLNDYLSDIETFEIAVGAKDVPPETCAVHNAEMQYLNTTKPTTPGHPGRPRWKQGRAAASGTWCLCPLARCGGTGPEK